MFIPTLALVLVALAFVAALIGLDRSSGYGKLAFWLVALAVCVTSYGRVETLFAEASRSIAEVDGE